MKKKIEVDNSERAPKLAPKMKLELDKVKLKVMRHQWDYVAVVAGLPGSGKSTFARGVAAYCCPDFSLDDIVFTADDFIQRTSECPEFSAIVYDECFEGMNTRVTLSPDFQRIINHLQLIRKRHLFIFLCLPNFFDLSKGIAVFRTSHLYVTYATPEGLRGRVMAFSRGAKRNLYVLGGKYMNYGAVHSNFQTTFRKNNHLVSEEDYEKKKDKVLLARAKYLREKGAPKKDQLAKAVIAMFNIGRTNREISEILGMELGDVSGKIQRYRKNNWLPKERPKKKKTQEEN